MLFLCSAVAIVVGSRVNLWSVVLWLGLAERSGAASVVEVSDGLVVEI